MWLAYRSHTPATGRSRLRRQTASRTTSEDAGVAVGRPGQLDGGGEGEHGARHTGVVRAKVASTEFRRSTVAGLTASARRTAALVPAGGGWASQTRWPAATRRQEARQTNGQSILSGGRELVDGRDGQRVSRLQMVVAMDQACELGGLRRKVLHIQHSPHTLSHTRSHALPRWPDGGSIL